MSGWNDPELTELFLKKTPLIDVRAPVEFNDGIIPYSVNLPLMTDSERHEVGLCYKLHGQSAAIELGHKLISGRVKDERVLAWKTFIDHHPQAEVFCFRGGLRSQISCQWLRDKGVDKTPITGGYKRLRNFFLSWIQDAPLPSVIRIGGLTGSGKTNVLKKVKNHIDLEELAHHRGSAFGPRGVQPAQKTFENNLALKLLELSGQKIIIEDESIMLGQITVPQRLFDHFRSSPLVILEVSDEERLETIVNDYVRGSHPEFFIQGLQKIKKRLGQKKIDELSELIQEAFSQPPSISLHRKWILPLLHEYYDPLYQKDLRYNQDKVIFRGNEEELLAFLARG